MGQEGAYQKIMDPINFTLSVIFKNKGLIWCLVYSASVNCLCQIRTLYHGFYQNPCNCILQRLTVAHLQNSINNLQSIKNYFLGAIKYFSYLQWPGKIRWKNP